ncbi:hypothetical protein M3A96_03060 [Helcobacillus massiliensis]|uniref:Integral membrane protein n=1 Tax=Helcobacillus massiliensis TaxID=521392 RepID=A0A839QPP7_9MICO|nr:MULTISPECIES: hypothetical protein [Helcobacillus]MBB3022473.1 hypothetical protein [Helcobacillus massiliensis]MCG7427315.1 hypothetical protein [Helcobacillus sp. ACRRO]MCT1557108.1 hypothetical protein [Helcobacillus massiliensis]MCT2036157.1 hypothetical protein [Helcobacillus massiliensis]MCT2331288.1 hypothetical protein [Helcobacillus massiliensis]
MSALIIATYIIGVGVGALGLLYVVKDLAADLILLGAQLLVLLVWIALVVGALLKAASVGGPTDAITFWGYALTGLTLPIAGLYLGFLERSRWGALTIAIASLTMTVLAARLPQIWAGGFA